MKETDKKRRYGTPEIWASSIEVENGIAASTMQSNQVMIEEFEEGREW